MALPDQLLIFRFSALGKKVGAVGKKGGKLGAVVEKKIMPVEIDPKKLVNFVCGSNIYVKGEDVKVSSNDRSCCGRL